MIKPPKGGVTYSEGYNEVYKEVSSYELYYELLLLEDLNL